VAITDKQERFVQEYLVDLNATQAAIRAGYSAATAGSAAAKLMANKAIRARIEQRQITIAADLDVTVKKIITELAKIGFANMEDYTRLVGDERVIDLTSADRDKLAAVTELTVEDYKEGRGEDARDVRRVKLKLGDKRAALVDLGKHLGMFKERVEHSVSEDFAAALIRARSRARSS
jgi:phage terminase small subunit